MKSFSPVAFPFLLLPGLWSTRNRARRRERGDLVRAVTFGGIGLAVGCAIFGGSFWLTWQLAEYGELGDYLLRAGLSWLFLTFLSFLAFSGLVTSLSTFFLSADLRLLLATPVTSRRIFYARFVRTLAQASWMVVVFLAPVLLAVGAARCAPYSFYAISTLTIVPFAVIPVVVGTMVTFALVNVFPARRARDFLMVTGLLFAGSIVILVRYIRPERLLSVESLPDITAFFATLQSPVTPFLPSHWAGETLFASLQGGRDILHLAALWTTAASLMLVLAAVHERWHFSGFSNSQEARKARFSRLGILDDFSNRMPISPIRRHLLVKDAKVFFRDVSQWSQLLLLVALMLLYLYNFQVLDLDRMPYVSGVIKNVYAFVNLGMTGLVMATVAVRFVFPSVSSEGAAFWIVRTAPIRLTDFLWSKFWIGLVPVLFLTEALTITGNYLLGVDPFLAAIAPVIVLFMSVALVGLATGLGARYPRFAADNPSQVAGSFGGIAFMVIAVLFVLIVVVLAGWPSSVYLFHQTRRLPLAPSQQLNMLACFVAVGAISIATCWLGMRTGVRALAELE